MEGMTVNNPVQEQIPVPTSTPGVTKHEKIRTPLAKIIVGESFGKPYYEIMWFSMDFEKCDIGYGSFSLDIVRDYLKDEFEIIEQDSTHDGAPVVRCEDCQNWKRNVGWKVNESAADWGLVFDTLLLIAFLQSDAETPEAAAEKFAKKLLDIPENVDILAETPEERRARSDKRYAQEWEKIKQEIEKMKISEDTTRLGNPASGCCRESWARFEGDNAVTKDGFGRKETDFCSYGERKDNDEH